MARSQKSPPKLQPLEHAVLRELRAAGLAKRPLLVAVSGGLDSMVLLHVLKRLQPLLKNALAVAHIHHGRRGATAQQAQYRDRARLFVSAQAGALGLPFFTNAKAPKKNLHSENELRDFRREELSKLADEFHNATLALAHHLDDQLETQLLRLIRGTALEGLQGMAFHNEGRVRPLLKWRREDLENYARTLKVRALKDPSNQSLDPLRNWLRQTWLKPLEKKSPGSCMSLARSLRTVTEMYQNVSGKSRDPFDGNDLLRGDLEMGIARKKFLALGLADQRALLARYIRALSIGNYTQGHLDEILRRLDNSRGEYTFSLLKHEWRINAERIQALKP